MKKKCVGMVRLNMADRALIDKQRLIDEFEHLMAGQEVCMGDASFTALILVDDLIQNAPVVERRKHGKWEEFGHAGWRVCSVCHNCYVEPEWIIKDKWKYCPQCGARLEI